MKRAELASPYDAAAVLVLRKLPADYARDGARPARLGHGKSEGRARSYVFRRGVANFYARTPSWHAAQLIGVADIMADGRVLA